MILCSRGQIRKNRGLAKPWFLLAPEGTSRYENENMEWWRELALRGTGIMLGHFGRLHR